MMPVKDMVGKRCGMLVIVSRSANQYKRAYWNALCDCGKTTIVPGTAFRRNLVKSCGCLKLSVKHGFARRGEKTSEYLIWVSMHQRCENPRNKAFHRYGGRGISVCRRWSKYENFIADMGVRPSVKHSIERKNNDGNYKPSNCEWADRYKQANNTKSNVIVNVRGLSMTLRSATKLFGVHYGNITSRIHRGMTPQKAFETQLSQEGKLL